MKDYPKIEDMSKEEFEIYFQNCPISKAMSIIGGKWKPIILNRIKMDVNRFGILQRSIPTISKQMLTAQLRELEDSNLIDRKIFAEVPPRVEYSITKNGETVFELLEALAAWGKMQK
ncbi:helix-turn-helix domain-containing protein [Flavobacterium sp.]|uniref:winged helix-turn-helix transcriptional regulator n=1 Tax=Flavobacterium sp. TaxID=239 RepID=UPI00260243A9|nr:helix-turn-helix domain-containing protein [Flavobacterium sp.]